MQDKTGRIEFLDWLRAVACFLVMLIHSCECIYSNDYTYSFPSETARWSIVFISGFARVAVPLFLMASAFLLVPVIRFIVMMLNRKDKTVLDYVTSTMVIEKMSYSPAN